MNDIEAALNRLGESFGDPQKLVNYELKKLEKVDMFSIFLAGNTCSQNSSIQSDVFYYFAEFTADQSPPGLFALSQTERNATALEVISAKWVNMALTYLFRKRPPDHSATLAQQQGHQGGQSSSSTLPAISSSTGRTHVRLTVTRDGSAAQAKSMKQIAGSILVTLMLTLPGVIYKIYTVFQVKKNISKSRN